RGATAERDFNIKVVPEGVSPTPASPPWLLARDAQGELTNDESPANSPKAEGPLRIVTEALPIAVLGKPYYACLEAAGGMPDLGTTRPGTTSASGKGRYWDLSYESLERAAARDAVDFKEVATAIPAVKVYLDGAAYTYWNPISTWRVNGRSG